MPPYSKAFATSLESSFDRQSNGDDGGDSPVTSKKDENEEWSMTSCSNDSTVYTNSNEAPYAIILSSAESIGILKQNPFDRDVTALAPRDINARLNLHLGQRWMATKFERLCILSSLWITLFVSWWESLLLVILYRIPDSVVRLVIFFAWKAYLPLHKRLLQRSTGLHPSVSLEVHALSTVLYLVHFGVTRASHIRYGLHILSAVRPNPPQALVETINATVEWRGQSHRLEGAFLHHNVKANGMTQYTILWIYGGAFMSGDAHGNIGTADVLCQSCKMDVWIPDYRKAPQHKMDDILEDVACAYHWLWEKRKKAGLDPSKIVLVGWSAGACLCTRLMLELKLTANDMMPTTAVLMSPFVRFEPCDTESSMHHYSLHDWLVTRNIMRVAEEALTLDRFWENKNEAHSPLSHSMKGLPPLCVIVSEHEAVYDETCQLVDHACRDGVHVTLGMWRYMPHGWYMFGGLLPEGQRALEFAGQYIQEKCRQ